MVTLGIGMSLAEMVSTWVWRKHLVPGDVVALPETGKFPLSLGNTPAIGPFGNLGVV